MLFTATMKPYETITISDAITLDSATFLLLSCLSQTLQKGMLNNGKTIDFLL